MPLGNLTSQFFANVYLNELDHYIKHKLKVKYYIRYVDDFVILHESPEKLESYKEKIDNFLSKKLYLELHPDKSKILRLGERITFLGFRIFCHHKLLKKSNIRKMRNKFETLKELYEEGIIDYDKIYNYFEGWVAYSKHANTYKLRKKFLEIIQNEFKGFISDKEINRHYRNK